MTHTISGTYSTLVRLDSAIDDPTTITSSGLVNDGLRISFAGLTLLNAGKIAQGTALNGVYLLAPGSVTNQSGGSIAGGRGISAGIFGEGGAVTVVNAGYIANFFGINLLLAVASRTKAVATSSATTLAPIFAKKWVLVFNLAVASPTKAAAPFAAQSKGSWAVRHHYRRECRTDRWRIMLRV